MEELRSQVRRAQRRLVFQQYMTTAVWWLFAALLIAVLGVAATKIWVLPVDGNVWMWAWFGGAAGVGLVGAAIWTFIIRRGDMDAAIEIDRRFGFKERVSSTLSLAPSDQESEIGQALVDDAVRRVARVDIRERFPMQVNWKMLLPFVPAVAVFAIALFVPDAIQKEAEASANTKAELETAKERQKNLRKRLLKQKEQLEQKGLKDAESIFKQIEESLGDVDKNKDGVSKKKALVELKDLQKKLADRRDMANSASELKKQLKRLANSQSKGPADELAKAMKMGDFKAAKQALNDLKNKIANGKLTKEQKDKLMKQMQQMQKNMQQLAQQQQAAKDQLEKKIQQMKQQGDMAAVEQLQQQLDKLAQQDQMMNQMAKMAQQMQQAADAMKQGDQQQAAQQMAQMMQDFQQLQDQLDDLESLDELMDELADIRDSMSCENCKGAGCQQCQGMGSGNMAGNGNGLGQGAGFGERPEEETDTGTYLSKVGAKPKAGEAVLKGFTSGPNLPGVSREEVKAAIKQNIAAGSDPLTDQRLPRDQRDHAIEYFNRRQK